MISSTYPEAAPWRTLRNRGMRSDGEGRAVAATGPRQSAARRERVLLGSQSRSGRGPTHGEQSTSASIPAQGTFNWKVLELVRPPDLRRCALTGESRRRFGVTAMAACSRLIFLAALPHRNHDSPKAIGIAVSAGALWIESHDKPDNIKA